jgi:hypothetical protein
MEWLIELLFEVFGEFLLQLFFESLAQAGIHIFSRPDRAGRRFEPWLLILGYMLFGVLGGAASIWLFPDSLLHSTLARRLYLIISPLAVAIVFALVGRWRVRHGRAHVGLDRLGYGYLFALVFALVRYRFATVSG